MNIEELITKYLTNEITAEENAYLLDWVISDDSNKKEFITTCQMWYTSSLLKNNFDSGKAYKKFLEHKSQETIKPKTIELWKKLSAVAAVAIITVGVFFLYEAKPEMVTVANSNQTNKTVVLSDGTQIVLQSGATITYPQEFSKKSRDISVEGTVFCNVKRDESTPFKISTKTLSVEVLGTSFEVSAKQNESHVIVESGKVKVAQNNTKNQSIIVKGERTDITSKGFVTSKNNDINFLSWKTGLLYFNKTPLQKVFSDIERHYSCKIVVKDSKIYNETITGTYQDFTLPDIITLINSAFPSLVFKNIDAKTIEVSIE